MARKRRSTSAPRFRWAPCVPHAQTIWSACRAPVFNRIIVKRTDGIGGRAHRFGVRIAPRKDVGDFETSESQRPRPPFAAFNCGVVLDFGRCRRVQHHEQGALAFGVPSAHQTIAIPFAVRIGRDRGRIVFDMGACQHGAVVQEKAL